MLLDTARGLTEELRKAGLKILVAESCTGGQIAAAITSVPGASDVFMGSLVTYRPEAKNTFLRMSPAVKLGQDLCTQEVATAMCLGLPPMPSCLCVAVTGVAGPEAVAAKAPGSMYVAMRLEERVWEKGFCLEIEPGKPRRECCALMATAVMQWVLERLQSLARGL